MFPSQCERRGLASVDRRAVAVASLFRFSSFVLIIFQSAQPSPGPLLPCAGCASAWSTRRTVVVSFDISTRRKVSADAPFPRSRQPLTFWAPLFIKKKKNSGGYSIISGFRLLFAHVDLCIPETESQRPDEKLASIHSGKSYGWIDTAVPGALAAYVISRSCPIFFNFLCTCV